MDDNFFEHFLLTSDVKEKLWDECIFIFDSSALLNFYEFTENTKKNIVDKIIKNIKDRLWIPHQVKFEFIKNRETVLKRTIEDKYNKLTDLSKVSEFVSKIETEIKSFDNNIKKEDTHPTINLEITRDLKLKVKELKESLESFNVEKNKEIEKQRGNADNIYDNDMLLESIDRYFSVGQKFEFSDMVEFMQEGEYRCKYEIPPGYKDNRKKGFQKIGDLIVWKEIIRHAKRTRRPIILIIDDITKDDWCYAEKSRKKITKPSALSALNFRVNGF